MKGKLDFLNKGLNKVGFELRKYNPRTSENLQHQRILEENNIELVIDVGANIGQYAKYLRNIGYEGEIISFEPLSEPYKKLVDASKNDSAWRIAPRMAIGNSDGEIEINVSKNLYSSSILNIREAHVSTAPESSYIGSETVRISKLDSLLGNIIPNKPQNSFLKIDVQGYEKQVLEGAVELLLKIKGVQSELSLVPLYEGQILYSDFISRMNKGNFTMHAIYPGFMDKATGQLLQFDGVFIKNDES